MSNSTVAVAMDLSVIICTHNPRKDYFEKVINSLQSQTLPFKQWELLLIDNASAKPLDAEVDLAWHSQARYIREEELGLTPARLRGLRESKAETIVFVDDDNILNSDYLETAFHISKLWPTLGIWGGQTKPAFEEEPPDWTKPYWVNLAIREFDCDRWSNISHHSEALPCGAGLCMRRSVAEEYARLAKDKPERMLLGRKGKALSSGEDTDIAITACDMGYGMGLFKSLQLTHLIPPSRLREDYLLKLEEGLSYSGTILNFLRQNELPKATWRRKILRSVKFLCMAPRERRFHTASRRGFEKAAQEILTF